MREINDLDSRLQGSKRERIHNLREEGLIYHFSRTQVNQNGSVYGRVSGRSNAGRTVIKVGSNTAVWRENTVDRFWTQ